MDASATRYAARVSMQTGRQEIIADLKNMVGVGAGLCLGMSAGACVGVCACTQLWGPVWAALQGQVAVAAGWQPDSPTLVSQRPDLAGQTPPLPPLLAPLTPHR